MSLLDDLRREAREIQAGSLQEDARQEADAAYYREYLHPCMTVAYRYFAEVIENLNIIHPEIHPHYPFSPLSKDPVYLTQSGYKIRVDDVKEPRQIDILCSASLERPVEFFVRTREAVEKHASLLESYEFPFHRKNFLDEHYEIRGATFLLEGPLRIRIRILAHAADRVIHIYLHNLEAQPQKRHRFPPEMVDAQLLERLARLLLRKETQLVEVSVSDDVRNELRQQLEAEEQRKQQELAEAYAARESDSFAEREARLLNRAKRWLVVTARNLRGR